MKLYWVTTEDDDEDWFIVASSPEEAAEYHEDAEGYDPGDATAEEILDIPATVPAEAGWPSKELLLSVGVKFLLKDQSRVVEINGRQFCEGQLEALINEVTDNVFEVMGKGRVNNTERPTLQ